MHSGQHTNIAQQEEQRLTRQWADAHAQADCEAARKYWRIAAVFDVGQEGLPELHGHQCL